MLCSAGTGRAPLPPPFALIDSSRFALRQPSPRSPATPSATGARPPLNFRLLGVEPEPTGGLLSVAIVRDRGPGIGDLPSILAGTYQSKSGMGVGILAAKRLMESVHIDTEASGTTVRLVQELPKGMDLKPLDLQCIAGEISRSSQAELLDELAAQNQELIATLDQLNTQRAELEKIKGELDETNRGVVALYDELETVQRVGRVLASKLDLTALLQAITDATVEVSGAECGGFFRKEPQGPNFTLPG